MDGSASRRPDSLPTDSEAPTVVVVGAGPGLGAAVARRFASGGCRVALVARSAERLTSLAHEIVDEGGRALAAPADVTNPEAVDSAFETVHEEFGPVDGLVSTLYAGGVEGGTPAETEPADLRGPFGVEVEGVYRCLKQVLPDIRRGGADEPGAVILTNSAAGRQARGDDVARSVSRGALANLASSLARAESEAGVHVVHAVVDGWIRTPELQAAFPNRPDDEWIDPHRLADAYWHLFTQPPSAWTFEPEFRCHTDGVDT